MLCSFWFNSMIILRFFNYLCSQLPKKEEKWKKYTNLFRYLQLTFKQLFIAFFSLFGICIFLVQFHYYFSTAIFTVLLNLFLSFVCLLLYFVLLCQIFDDFRIIAIFDGLHTTSLIYISFYFLLLLLLIPFNVVKHYDKNLLIAILQASLTHYHMRYYTIRTERRPLKFICINILFYLFFVFLVMLFMYIRVECI